MRCYDTTAPDFPQSWNPYAYALGNPATNTDPTGLVAFQPCQSGGGCTYDDNGCTVDGMSVPCNLAENWNSMPGGGGIVQCPGNNCEDCPPGQTCSPYRAVEGSGGETQYWGRTFEVILPTLGQAEPSSNLATFQGGGYFGWTYQYLGSAGGCGWDMGCEFFSGFVNLLLNNQPSGALQMAGAEAAVGGTAVATAVVAPYVPVALATARAGLGEALENPEFFANTREFLLALQPSPLPATTWWAVGGAYADEIYENWDTITGWFGH